MPCLSLNALLQFTDIHSEIFFSANIFCSRDSSTKATTQGLRDGGRRGTSYLGPVGTGAREAKSTHAKFFCNQAQNYLCKPVANVTINLFL